MLEKKIKKLETDAFKKYGRFEKIVEPDQVYFGQDPIRFYRDMVQMDTCQTGNLSFSVCRVTNREMVVNIAEYHSKTPEGIIPLDGDILIHVGYATKTGEIKPEEFEIFHVPMGTIVILRPGVWHHAPFTYGCDKVNTLIILPERTYANDCEVVRLQPESFIKIVE